MRGLLLVILVFSISINAIGQCEFDVNNGGFEYTLEVDLNVTDVIYTQSGSTCNVQLEVSYDIDIIITSAPAWWDESLFVLQGTFDCLDASGTSFFDLPNGGGTGTVMSATFSYSSTDCGEVFLDCPITLQIQGPGGLNENGNCGMYIEGGVVPVVLDHFTAKKTVEETIFSWATKSEINFSHFNIETSFDAITWNKEKSIMGQNEVSGSEYSYPILKKLNSYYTRLKIVDKDGAFFYSDVLHILKDDTQRDQISYYPNPAQDIIYFKDVPAYFKLEVYNYFGDLLLKKSMSQNALDISNLESGHYILKLEIGEGSIEYKNLIIQ